MMPNYFCKVYLAKYLADGKGQVFAVKSVDKMEIIKGDDIDVTMAERRILELGTKRNFLTQIHSSFQVKCQLYIINEIIPKLNCVLAIADQRATVLRDGIPQRRRPHVPPHERRQVLIPTGAGTKKIFTTRKIF